MQLKYDSNGSSPMSSMSPCSSRSISPALSTTFNIDENEDDDSYSPVCSDHEETAEVDKKKIADEPLRSLLGLLDDIEEAVSENEEDMQNDFKKNEAQSCQNLDRLENLIFRATLLTEKRWELAHAVTFTTLFKAINMFGTKNGFATSLTNILMINKFFDNIVKIGVPHQIYQLTKIEELHVDSFGFLNALTIVAESYYGNGQLLRLLESKNVMCKSRAVITIAYVIRTPTLLLHFLKTHQLFEELVKIILNDNSSEAESHDLCAEAADALTCMSTNTLNIKLPVNSGQLENQYEIFNPESQKNLQKVCDMRFILHTVEEQIDVVHVIASNKQLLCESSEVFNCMLNSDFREGHEGEIHLHQYTKTGLCYFLNLLSLKSQGLEINVPSPQNTHVLLEALELVRIYIVPSLETILCDLLLTRISDDNCLSIFGWSIRNHHKELSDMAIFYYLSAALTPHAKVALFQQAKYSDLYPHWQDCLYNTLVERLEHCSY